MTVTVSGLAFYLVLVSGVVPCSVPVVNYRSSITMLIYRSNVTSKMDEQWNSTS